jgi:hypothetical protein
VVGVGVSGVTVVASLAGGVVAGVIDITRTIATRAASSSHK